ncbi:Crp/Fnr family transcriptional regulator [Pedobacter aquatilis]|uniref:Crp/Fnr family transcriptional regulator n=1 Tax=Pedobacter aquatilis TaxID=351343 RepID=UPI00292CCB35|nr:Crp/Fnr family transcriptional regulator [Pedobacter aquatilis]
MDIIHEDQLAISVLISYLKSINTLSEGLISLYRQYCKVMRIRKNKYILSPVDNNQYLYFIVHGTARGFIKDEGIEITTCFAFENEMMAAMREPQEHINYSPEYLHALENCLIVCIPYALIEENSTDFPELNFISRQLLALQSFYAAQRSILARIPKAADRYKKVLLDERFKLSPIPLRYLASYLSIRLETLSRIRRKETDALLSLASA